MDCLYYQEIINNNFNILWTYLQTYTIQSQVYISLWSIFLYIYTNFFLIGNQSFIE